MSVLQDLEVNIEKNTVNGDLVTIQGEDVEGNVQAILWDIVVCATDYMDSDNDGLTMSIKTVWDCVDVETLVEFVGCLKTKLSESENAILDDILQRTNGYDTLYRFDMYLATFDTATGGILPIESSKFRQQVSYMMKCNGSELSFDDVYYPFTTNKFLSSISKTFDAFLGLSAVYEDTGRIKVTWQGALFGL